MNADAINPKWTMRVVVLKRSAKTVKGGRRYSFGALVVVGNACGCIGLGWGKSREVADALHKAERVAVAQKVQVLLEAGRIPHEVGGKFCGAEVLLRPAPRGTGIIASKAVRDVLECAGVKPANVVKATIRALLSLRLKAVRVHPPRLKLPDFNTGQDPLRLN